MCLYVTNLQFSCWLGATVSKASARMCPTKLLGGGDGKEKPWNLKGISKK